MTIEGTGIVDDNHALLVGNIVGALMAALRDSALVEPMTDKDGNYTNKISIAKPSGTYTLIVEKD